MSKTCQPDLARQKLEAAGSLHWFHWCIVGLSLALTFFAWYYADSQQGARIQAKFDREAEQVIELVQERMRKYEDALWSGVALVDSLGGDVEFDLWKQYAQSINIKQKYPGINGIGVIHAVPDEGIENYLKRQRVSRPAFQIHPPHNNTDKLPISYIIPEEDNYKAVGLDMAHETNRLTAAQKSRDTGEAQITGPIHLVQDSGKTPGFLFFAPFYQEGLQDAAEKRKDAFSGMVYAPFVVKKLMEGTLEKEKRHVGLRLTDEDQVLYDEHVASEADYDPEPLFKKAIDIPLYGRTWTFDIWSAKSFRKAASDRQPLTILIGGIAIDTMLVLLFLSMSRSAKQALVLADSVTVLLEKKAEQLGASEKSLADRAQQLEASNQELEQFAYVASHDLQEPLRKIFSYAQLFQEECGKSVSDDGQQYLGVIMDGANRMKRLVSDLLSFSRINRRGCELAPADTNDCVQTALENLEVAIDESGAKVDCEPLPALLAEEGQLTLLFQNLIGNAIKYQSGETPRISIGGRDRGEMYEVYVEDNGIGIDPQFFDRIFVIFQRLHNRREHSGTGIGLAICKRIVEQSGGEIWVESSPGRGSTFYFTLTKAPSQIAFQTALPRSEHAPREQPQPVGSTD